MPSQTTPIKVAIVEDDYSFRTALQLTLNGDTDIRCTHVFSNGEEALHNLASQSSDVILMDLDLGVGNMDGIACINKLKEKAPDTLFMVLTDFEDQTKVFDAISAGAMGYILKSESPEKIIQSIHELRDGGSPMSPTIARQLVKYISTALPDKKKQTRSNLLTPREIEVIEIIAKGKLEKEVGVELGISATTVKKHIANIYEKLQVNTRVEALNIYFDKP